MAWDHATWKTNMKNVKLFLSRIFVFMFPLVPASFAADGTITFSGMVTAQTCTIAGNGGASSFTVALPTVMASSLAAAGAASGRTPFSIGLSACNPGTGNVSVYFEPGETTDPSTGRLVNVAAGGATNVQIVLLNADATNIQAGAAYPSQNSQVVALASGSATLQYYAQYVATGVATGGAVQTTVTYSIVYP